MSVDGYKIAIQLSLVENVAKGLASLAPHFTNANLSAKQLEERLERIGKLTLAGGAMAGVGAFLLKGFIKMQNGRGLYFLPAITSTPVFSVPEAGPHISPVQASGCPRP